MKKLIPSEKYRAALRIVSITVIILYLTFISVFVANTTFEFLLFEFFLIVLIFWGARRTEFLKDWVPFVSAFVFYEFLRGFADNWAPLGKSTYYIIFELERLIFPVLPTRFLQDHFAGNSFINTVSFIGYVSYFYYSFLVGFIYWLKDKKLFRTYIYNFLLLTYISLLIFFLVPTAPPWYVNKYLYPLEIKRIFYDSSLFENLRGLSLYRYFVGGNPVAALPSLHVSWVAFTSFFIVRHAKKKLALFTLLMPVLVSFSVVINSEHWLIDIIMGSFLAYLIAQKDYWSSLIAIFRRQV